MDTTIKIFRVRMTYLRRTITFILSAVAFIGTCDRAIAYEEDLVPRSITTMSGVTYALYPQGDLKFDFVVSRPTTKKSDVLFCIPAAFTTPSNHVDGITICNGIAANTSVLNKNLGGAVIIEKGNCKFFSTDKGVKLTPSLMKDVATKNASLFQQFLLVHEGKPATFKDKSKFQRRAICQFEKSFGVVESYNPIDFATFNRDLVEIGAREALYCDMGAWDEGWYRASPDSKVVKIGLDRSQTAKQSNWLLLRKFDAHASTPPKHAIKTKQSTHVSGFKILARSKPAKAKP